MRQETHCHPPRKLTKKKYFIATLRLTTTYILPTTRRQWQCRAASCISPASWNAMTLATATAEKTVGKIPPAERDVDDGFEILLSTKRLFLPLLMLLTADFLGALWLFNPFAGRWHNRRVATTVIDKCILKL